MKGGIICCFDEQLLHVGGLSDRQQGAPLHEAVQGALIVQAAALARKKAKQSKEMPIPISTAAGKQPRRA